MNLNGYCSGIAAVQWTAWVHVILAWVMKWPIRFSVMTFLIIFTFPEMAPWMFKLPLHLSQRTSGGREDGKHTKPPLHRITDATLISFSNYFDVSLELHPSRYLKHLVIFAVDSHAPQRIHLFHFGHMLSFCLAHHQVKIYISYTYLTLEKHFREVCLF